MNLKNMNEELIRRINELARKQKSGEGLTEAEKEEQAALRKEYIRIFRANLRREIERIDIKNPDGSIVSVKERHDRKFGKGEFEE